MKKSKNEKTYHSKPNSRISNRQTAEELRAGDIIVVTIKRLGINGEGVGYYRRKAVFIQGALPDEVIKAEVIRAEPKYITAKITDIEKRSPIGLTPLVRYSASAADARFSICPMKDKWLPKRILSEKPSPGMPGFRISG